MGTKIITDDYIFKAKVRFQNFVAVRFGINIGENPHHDLDFKKQFAKAWINFNGTGTVAIRDSFNVSSITDSGVGLYIVNFINNMLDTNYCVVSKAPNRGGADIVSLHGQAAAHTLAVDSVGVVTGHLSGAGALGDIDHVTVTIFGS